jgi:hypothetical protein
MSRSDPDAIDPLLTLQPQIDALRAIDRARGPLMSWRVAVADGTCVAAVNRRETVSFDVLIAQRQYAGATRPPCKPQQCGVSDFHSYALALMN